MKNAGHLGNPEKWKQDHIKETEQQAAYDRHKKDEAARAPHKEDRSSFNHHIKIMDEHVTAEDHWD